MRLPRERGDMEITMAKLIDAFFTKRELAKLCRCSERTIDRLLEAGDAPPVTRLSPGRIIFPAAAAMHWLDKRTSKKKADAA